MPTQSVDRAADGTGVCRSFIYVTLLSVSGLMDLTRAVKCGRFNEG